MSADWIRFGGELLNPLVHYLSVAKCAEPAEEFARDFAHGRPGAVGVHLFHDCGDRSAAADGYTKIMDDVRVGRRGGVFPPPHHAVHPHGNAPAPPSTS